ncbi:MAG: hypothetical protein JWM27_4531 [Gemmatimonadetes bacterium]|nr:hypothetical protein [Gemmatimonadota bacterium]
MHGTERVAYGGPDCFAARLDSVDATGAET